MTRIEFTHHAKDDREERILRIATTIGFGETVRAFPRHNQYGDTLHCLTDTGVIIIKDRSETKVITMFVCSKRQLMNYYGNRKPPKSLYNAVVRNEKRKFLFEI